MALTPLRWIAVAAACMLAVVIVALREDPPRIPSQEETSLDSLAVTASLHQRRATVFAQQVRILAIAESLRRAPPRGAQEPVRLSYGASYPAAARPALDSAVAFARRRLGNQPSIGVDVIAFLDTSRIEGHRPFYSLNLPFYVLPSRPTERCIVVMASGDPNPRDYSIRSLQTDDAKQQILGPCAYYAAFGMPGEPIRRWLRVRGAHAFGGSWQQPTRPVYFQGDFFPTTIRQYFSGPPEAYDMMSNRGVQCLVGDYAACDTAILRPNIRTWQLSVGQATRLGYSLGPTSRRNGVEFGGKETELLADMVRSIGRERFRQFWTSNDSVPAAFQKATGMPLGEWVSQWAAEGVDRIERGPRPHAIPVASGLAIALLCLGWAVLSARRRQFS